MGCLRMWPPRQDASVIIALFALCIWSDTSILKGPDNIALHHLPLFSIAAPMVVHQNLVCAFLDRLTVVNLLLILGILNLGIPDSLLTVSMSIVKCHLDLV